MENSKEKNNPQTWYIWLIKSFPEKRDYYKTSCNLAHLIAFLLTFV